MDTDQFDWWDGDMFPGTTILHWMGNSHDPFYNLSPFLNAPAGQTEFLRSYVRSEREVYRKLNTVLKFEKQPFHTLFQIEELFERHATALSQAVTGEVMNYLANAWTIQGAGLFDLSNSRNLEIALDLGIQQYLLPYVREKIRETKELRQGLEELLQDSFPYSTSFLKTLS